MLCVFKAEEAAAKASKHLARERERAEAMTSDASAEIKQLKAAAEVLRRRLGAAEGVVEGSVEAKDEADAKLAALASASAAQLQAVTLQLKVSEDALKVHHYIYYC